MKKLACIFASTKYQMINAIHIAVLYDGELDLYIIDEGIYTDCESIATHIREEEIFGNVIYIKYNEKYKFVQWHYVNSFICYINYKKLVETYLLSPKYEIMFFCTTSLIEKLTRIYLMKESNWQVSFIMYEEGIGSYTGGMEGIRTKKELFVRRLLFKKQINEVNCDKLLYCPEIYVYSTHSMAGQVHKLPSITTNSREVDAYNRIFEFKSEMIISEKVLFMDANISADSEIAEVCNTLMHQIYSICQDELIVKAHPSSQGKKYQEPKYYMYSSIPFELIAANSNIEDKIIISYFSSSLITPKLIFGQEPTIILINKIVRQNNKDGKTQDDIFLMKLQQIYNPTKLYLPETGEQLIQILRFLLEKKKNDMQKR